MQIVAIDPGLSGAVASLVNEQLVDARPLPLLEERHGKKTRMVLDAKTLEQYIVLRAIISGDLRIWIENVTAMPNQGVTSTFRFGQTFGKIQAIAELSGHPVQYVNPNVWKRKMGLNRSKGLSRTRAMQEWPGCRDWFKRAKDEGKAEAALLGLYGVRHGAA